MKKPLISVLICVYNEEDEIKQCLKSVLNQTTQNFEIIIVDDGSIDETKNKIKEIKDRRIKYHYKKNTGLTKSLNYGLEKCTGKYIARLDADNRCKKNRFEKQLSVFEKNEKIVLVGSRSEKIFQNGHRTRGPKTKNVKKDLIKTCIIPHSSIMVKSEILKKEKYDESFKTSQDYELYVRIASKHKIHLINEPLIIAKIKSNSITQTKSNWERFKAYSRIRYKAYKKLDLPWWYFIYLFKSILELITPKKIMELYVKRKTNRKH